MELPPPRCLALICVLLQSARVAVFTFLFSQLHYLLLPVWWYVCVCVCVFVTECMVCVLVCGVEVLYSCQEVTQHQEFPWLVRAKPATAVGFREELCWQALTHRTLSALLKDIHRYILHTHYTTKNTHTTYTQKNTHTHTHTHTETNSHTHIHTYTKKHSHVLSGLTWAWMLVLLWHPAAAEACEPGQPAGGLQEEETPASGLWVLWANRPQWTGQTPKRVSVCVYVCSCVCVWAGEEECVFIYLFVSGCTGEE